MEKYTNLLRMTSEIMIYEDREINISIEMHLYTKGIFKYICLVQTLILEQQILVSSVVPRNSLSKMLLTSQKNFVLRSSKPWKMFQK